MRLLSIFLIFLFLFAVSANAANKVIFVVAAIPLGEADNLISNHLAKYGLQLEPHAMTETQPVDSTGAIGVFISESVTSATIAAAYNKVTLPIICTEFYIIDDMGFAADGTFTNADHRTITIVNANHPIAGGLNGQVEVTTKATDLEEIQAGSAMQGEVNVVAKAPGGGACIMYYEKGAKGMGDTIAAGRRLFLFPHSKAIVVFNDIGWGIFERSVLWGLGMPVSSVSPAGSLTTTWGEIKR
jgi:hypothetical protein